MDHHFRVAVVDHDPAASAALADGLAAYGCAVFSAEPGATLAEELRGHAPHVIVLNAGNGGAAVLDSMQTLKQLAATDYTPSVLCGGNTDGALQAKALELGIDAVLPAGSRDIELYTRVRALARLKVMQTELVRRDATRRRYGISREPFVPAPAPSDAAAVLAVGDLGANLAALTTAVGDASRLTFADDPQSAIAALSTGTFDAAVVAVNGAPGEWLTMCGDIRNNPLLFNLPILLIADAECFPDPMLAYERGATDLLLLPLRAEELGLRLNLLVRQQRYHRIMQEAYRRAPGVETCDGLTGLYSFGYLHDYLASLIADSQPAGKEFTVALFKVEGMAQINRKLGYAGGDGLLRQVGGLIGRIVRGEDLTARYGANTFCVVMPDTPGGLGKTATRRICDVVEQTEFGVATASEPVSVHLAVGCATIEPNDTAETLLAHAREALK